MIKRALTGHSFPLSFVTLSVFLSLSHGNLFAKEPPLRLEEVLQSVRCHYPQVTIARLEIIKAQGAFIAAKGQFDPTVDASTRSQPIGGYINNYADTQVTLPTLYNGIKLVAGYRNGEGNFPIYYQNYLTNSSGEYRAGMSLPLLQDRLIDKQRTNLFSTAELMQMKQQDAAAIQIKIYQETIKAYWQWVEAGLQLRIFKKLLHLAETRQHAIEYQAHQGDLPTLAITENLQQIMQRQQLLNQGRMLFEQTAVNLSLYYRDKQGLPRLPSTNRLPVSVSTKTKPIPGVFLNLKKHPSLKKLASYTKVIQLKRDLAHNALLPQLDATAYTFKQNGTGGYPLLIPQAAMLGLSFKFPIFRREAKGKLIQAESELNQIKTESTFLYQQLYNDLSNVLIGIKRGIQQINLLQREWELANKMERAEIKKFYAGDSSLFLVNQREQSSTQVAVNLLRAKIELEELHDKARFFSSTRSDVAQTKHP